MKKAIVAGLSFVCLVFWTDVKNPDIYVPDSLERKCLVQALWYETRGEPEEGIRAVASVILNRAAKKNKTICATIQERKQFSYRNLVKDERKLIPAPKSTELDELLLMHKIVTEVQNGTFNKNLPDDVLWYHTKKVKPLWSRKMQVHKVIGQHKFLKEKTWKI